MVVLGRDVLYDVWVELGFWLGDSGDDYVSCMGGDWECDRSRFVLR